VFVEVDRIPSVLMLLVDSVPAVDKLLVEVDSEPSVLMLLVDVDRVPSVLILLVDCVVPNARLFDVVEGSFLRAFLAL